MINVYPFGSGSIYTASYAVTSSYAFGASLITYVTSASKAGVISNPRSGSDGVGVCKISYEDYQALKTYNYIDECNFYP